MLAGVRKAQPLELFADEAVVETNVVCNEHGVFDHLDDFAGDFVKFGRVAYHVLRNSR